MREGNEALKSEDVNGIGGRGLNDSLSIVMGRAKKDESDVNVLKASWRSLDAGRC